MSKTRSIYALAAAAGVALALLTGTQAAQARGDVHWSIGVSSPGVSVGMGTGYPVYAPAPVYVAPRPVYYAPPPPVYYMPPARPVYYAPPVHYVAQPPAYYYRDRNRGRHFHRHPHSRHGRRD